MRPAGTAAVVPAYFHPAVVPADWATLADPGPTGAAGDAQLRDGPGSARDPAFTAVPRSCAAAASRSRATSTPTTGGARSGRRCRRRPVPELVPAGPGRLPRPGRRHRRPGRALPGAARTPAGGDGAVVFRHGVHPDPAYAAIADLLVTFEARGRATATSWCPGGRAAARRAVPVIWCTRCRPGCSRPRGGSRRPATQVRRTSPTSRARPRRAEPVAPVPLPGAAGGEP